MGNSINISDYKSKQREITDNDLLSVFMGLVKLIKRKANNDYEQNEKVEKGFLIEKINFLENEINDRDKKITELKDLLLRCGKNKRKSQLKIMIDKLSKYKVGNKQLVN